MNPAFKSDIVRHHYHHDFLFERIRRSSLRVFFRGEVVRKNYTSGRRPLQICQICVCMHQGAYIIMIITILIIIIMVPW